MKSTLLNLQSIGDRIREERLRLELTQDEMAELGGVSRPSHRLYELNRREPPLSYLLRLSEGGVDFVYLLSGKTGHAQTGETLCLKRGTLEKLYITTRDASEDEAGKLLNRRASAHLFGEMCHTVSQAKDAGIDFKKLAADLMATSGT